MIFIHFQVYKRLSFNLLTFSKCRKTAVFAKNILYTFASKLNDINHEKQVF